MQNTAFRALRDGVHAPLTGVVLAAGACCTPTLAQTASPATAAQSPEVRNAPTARDSQLAQFDPEILRSRGLSPLIGEYFRDGPRFQPGVQPVFFNVNGNELGRKSAVFDRTGQLCFTPALVASLGLKPLRRSVREGPGNAVDDACPDYRDQAPQALIVLRPNEGVVELTVPAGDVLALALADRTETRGVGAMLNYRGYAYESRFGGGNRAMSRYLDTELGFNAGDWIVRSHQMYAQNDGVGRFQWQSAYAQRTFVDQKQVLQAGRITTRSALYGGLPIIGAQWFPERGLRQLRSYPVAGVASTRARVEIRQGTVLLYSTVVPPGPFVLTDYPLNDAGTDLRVSVIEETGGEQVITVPASSLLLASDNTQNEGFSIAAGQLWSPADVRSYDGVPVVSGAYGWALGSVSGTLGGLMSTRYASAGTAMNWKFAERASTFAQVVASRDGGRGVQGVQGSAALAWRAGEALSLGVSGNLRTAGYRTVHEAARLSETPVLRQGARSQVGATASMNLGRWGSMSAAVTRASYFGAESGNVYSVSWGVSWRRMSLQVGVSRSTARAYVVDTGLPQAPQRSPTAMYLTLSIPLGPGVTGSSYVRNVNDLTRYGAGVDQRVNDMVAYRLATERGSDRAGTEVTGSVNVIPRYASVSLGVSDRQAGGRSYYGELTGSVLATAAGVGFSPYAVQDTFGAIRTGNVVGLKIDTPQGPVWSGPGGVAAVPALLPYQASRLEASLKDAALDVDIDNPLQMVQAGRGAVLDMDLGARRVRRVLFTVTDALNVPLPPGLPVLRGDEFFSSTVQGGRVVVSRLVEGDVLSVTLADGKRCVLQEIQTRPVARDQFFESGTAICK